MDAEEVFLTLTALCGWCMEWSLLLFFIGILWVKKKRTGILEHPALILKTVMALAILLLLAAIKCN